MLSRKSVSGILSHIMKVCENLKYEDGGLPCPLMTLVSHLLFSGV